MIGEVVVVVVVVSVVVLVAVGMAVGVGVGVWGWWSYRVCGVVRRCRHCCCMWLLIVAFRSCTYMNMLSLLFLPSSSTGYKTDSKVLLRNRACDCQVRGTACEYRAAFGA